LKSRILGISKQGDAILNDIRMHQPNLTIQRAVNVLGEILAEEGQQLANYLQPAADRAMSEYASKIITQEDYG